MISGERPVVAARIDRAKVVEALLAFSAKRGQSKNFQTSRHMINTEPFAFIVALLFNQGISANRAWTAPDELRQRLGLDHLDPARVVDLAEVERAVKEPSPLHRFVNTMPRWIVEAAKQVMSTKYGGDASAIWRDEPTAQELYRRLDAFLGMGQKKAALGVRILAEARPGSIRDLEHCDIAFDVQVRRVFARAGLVEAGEDDLEHVVAAARQLHPTNPSALDYPAWLVGREWCHPTNPNHEECALTRVCPRLMTPSPTVGHDTPQSPIEGEDERSPQGPTPAKATQPLAAWGSALRMIAGMGRWQAIVKRNQRSAAQLRKGARLARPRVRRMLADIVAKLDLDGRMAGVEFQLKSRERLVEKMAEMAVEHPDWTPEEVRQGVPDALRYTIIFQIDTYSEQISQTLDACRQEGFRIGANDVQSHWADGNVYKGVHAFIRTPEEFKFELQFHTPESWRAKQDSRAWYEEIRNRGPRWPFINAPLPPDSTRVPDQASERSMRFYMTETGGGLFRKIEDEHDLRHERLDRQEGWVSWSPLTKYLMNGEPGVQSVTPEVADTEARRWGFTASEDPSPAPSNGERVRAREMTEAEKMWAEPLCAIRDTILNEGVPVRISVYFRVEGRRDEQVHSCESIEHAVLTVRDLLHQADESGLAAGTIETGIRVTRVEATAVRPEGARPR